MDPIVLIFQLIVLIFSIMIHEIAHGAMALRLGDDTAQKMGRLTLNPLKHIDPIGSIILPLMLLIFRSPFLIGWAKPVPYNPNQLKNPRSGSVWVALAGPLSNIILAVFFGLILRFFTLPEEFVALIVIIVYINLLLAVFNLVPVPPLDGSKLLFYLIPDRYFHIKIWLEQFGFLILLLLVFSGALQWLAPIIKYIFGLIVG